MRQLPLIHTLLSYYLSCATFGVVGIDAVSVTDIDTGERQCVSCMNQLARTYWNQLARYYTKPKMFGQQCDKDAKWLTTVPCKQSCVTLMFRPKFMGVEINPIYVRGCFTDLVKLKWRYTTLQYVQHVNACRTQRMTELFDIRNVSPSKNAFLNVKLQMCTCKGDRCNQAATHTPHFICFALWFIAVWFKVLRS